MRHIKTFIGITIKETFRNRLLGGIALFGLILIGLSNLLSKFTIQEQLKFIKDIGLSGITFFGQLMSIIAGGSIIADDYEKKTINQIRTNPVTPFSYISGRYLGIVFVLFINMVFFTIVFYGSLYFSYVVQAYKDMPAEHNVSLIIVLLNQIPRVLAENSHLLTGILMIYLQMLIIAAMALMLSFFFSKLVNFIICVLFFILGHLTVFTDYFAKNLSFTSKIILKVVSFILPSFEYFNVSDYLVLNRIISSKYQLWVFCYAIAYIIPLLLLSVLVFERKEIK